MAAKYSQLIKEMYETHQELLDSFQEIHDKYIDDQKRFQTEFNEIGAKVIDVMQFYERQLCGKTERSGMGVYSSKLAEKYWTEIKKRFSMIEFIGVKIG